MLSVLLFSFSMRMCPCPLCAREYAIALFLFHRGWAISSAYLWSRERESVCVYVCVYGCMGVWVWKEGRRAEDQKWGEEKAGLFLTIQWHYRCVVAAVDRKS